MDFRKVVKTDSIVGSMTGFQKMSENILKLKVMKPKKSLLNLQILLP